MEESTSTTTQAALGGAGGDESRPEKDEDGSGGAAGAAGSGEEPHCEPTDDAPDDNFKDTNCDGIDGDAENAVFVSTDGSDEGAGTMEDPVQHLNRAIYLGIEQEKDVYVCNGTYPENLVVSRAVNLYGGYDCTDGWRRIAGRAAVEPPAGIPLSVIAVTEPMEVERFAFRAPEALGTTGESSQAARVVSARQVRFSRVEFRAEDAADGKPGLDGQEHEVPQAESGADGFRAQLDDCNMRLSLSAACTEEAQGGNGFPSRYSDPFGVYEQRGGEGGHGANGYLSGATCGESASGEAGQAGTPASSSKDGSDGASVQDGAGSSSGFGSLAWGGYYASNSGSAGDPGERGLPGRGGAGGTSTVYYTQDICEGRYTRGGGGGQGGYGGCAGFPGGGGGGGGGSIALVIMDSAVILEDARIITGQGGDGGGAGHGALGQLGGEPGNGGDGSSISGAASTYNAGEAGGRGGDGSRGGNGGAGGGGPSIGIVVVGEQPELNDCSFELGGPGFGGTAVTGPDAPDGVAGEVYTLTY